MNHPTSTARSRLLWMTLALFLSYLSVALPLPVLPIHVTHDLHLPTWAGGLAVGIAFLSTVLSRKYVGNLCDLAGGKISMMRGLTLYAAASAICLLAAWTSLPATGAYGILLAGRLLLGIGESLTLVGMISWNIARLGPEYSGRIISMVGLGMYGAYATGGPLGLTLLNRIGFGGLMGVCILLPLAGLLMVYGIPSALSPADGEREGFLHIIGRIWKHGTVVFLQGVGIAILGAYISLYFLRQGWAYAGLGLTCFGAAFVLVRILFGHMPDKIGGVKVAIISLAIEACGLYLLWVAPDEKYALLGALLTGLGCSMVFPAMGVEVMRAVPPSLGATAVGGFSAFQDIANAAAAPIAGLFADYFGFPVVFLIGGLAATFGLGLAAYMRIHPDEKAHDGVSRKN